MRFHATPVGVYIGRARAADYRAVGLGTTGRRIKVSGDDTRVFGNDNRRADVLSGTCGGISIETTRIRSIEKWSYQVN